MKKIFKKLLLFIAAYLLVSAIIGWFVPYYWGNPWYSAKIRLLEKMPEEKLPNTYFFGSSRVYRQVDPRVFDSTVSALTNEDIQSYNLGATATFCPQTYYLYENFLKSDLAEHTDYAFMELMEIDRIAMQVMHQERTTYWQNLPDITFVFRSVFNDRRISFGSKMACVSKYLVSYIEHAFHLGHFREVLFTEDYYNRLYAGPAEDGFYSLEAQLRQTADDAIEGNLEERRATLMQDSTELTRRAESSIRHHNQEQWPVDKVHLQRIKRLIEKSAEKDIKLVFVLSPRNSSPTLVKLMEQIPAGHKIDLSLYNKYPEFYRLKYSFDRGHFNNRGAKLYTTNLAQNFVTTSQQETAESN